MRARMLPVLIFAICCGIAVPLKTMSDSVVSMEKPKEAIPGKVVIVENDGRAIVHKNAADTAFAGNPGVNLKAAKEFVPKGGVKVYEHTNTVDSTNLKTMTEKVQALAKNQPVNIAEAVTSDAKVLQEEISKEKDGNDLLLKMADERMLNIPKNGTFSVPKRQGRTIVQEEENVQVKQKVKERKKLAIIAEKSSISEAEFFPSPRR